MKTVPDPARHFNYRWDDYLQDVVRASTQVKPFDYDILIQITPETNHDQKDKIGRNLLALMTKATTSQAQPLHSTRTN